jgi:uncharacterized membrane protein
MSRIHKSVEVNVPVRTAYNQWTQFEQFPKFMQGVVQVKQLDDTHLHWVARVGGRTKEWDAEIMEQVPDQRITWRAQQGTPNAGMVSFESVDGHTRVDLEMQYAPQDLREQVGDILGFASRQVESDLKRFKEFIESRGEETGAWRGHVPPHE